MNMMKNRNLVEIIADGVFLFVLACSVMGAVMAVYQIVYYWRQA